MRKITLIFLLAVIPMIGQAQRYLGVATGNWSGTNGLYLNPANIADSRHKFVVDLFSVNLGMNNNMATVNGGISGLFNIGDGDLSNTFTFNNKKQFSLIDMGSFPQF